MTKQQFSVQGMHCVSCALTVEDALENLNGVSSANASYAKQIVVIEYDESQITPDGFQLALKTVGYTLETKS